MPESLTPKLKLRTPEPKQRNYHQALDANRTVLDGLVSVGGLVVAPRERPSASRRVSIAAGRFRSASGPVDVAAVADLELADNQTTRVWATPAAAIASGIAFPATPHVPLAEVVVAGGLVTNVVDRRPCWGLDDGGALAAGAGGVVAIGGSSLLATLGVGSATVPAARIASGRTLRATAAGVLVLAGGDSASTITLSGHVGASSGSAAIAPGSAGTYPFRMALSVGWTSTTAFLAVLEVAFAGQPCKLASFTGTVSAGDVAIDLRSALAPATSSTVTRYAATLEALG